MPLLNKTIKFVIIKNPFVPESRLVLEREYEHGKSLYDYIGDLNGQYAIVHNGEGVEIEKLKESFPVGGDIVGISPIPAGGGGGGKSVLRIVTVVALAAITAGVGAYAAGAYATTMGVAATSASAIAFGAGAAAVVGIGGNMLINKLLPPTVAGSGSFSSSQNVSQTYGIDGAKNTSTEGVAVPVCYGTFRTAGNIVAQHTTMVGKDQWLHMLINVGEGVVATFDPSKILINDQNISDFGSDVRVDFMHGNAGQNCFAEFSSQITPNQVINSRDLVSESEWSFFDTEVDVEVEAVEVGLASQIYRIDDNGNQCNHSVNVQAEFRRYDSSDEGDWANINSGIKRKYIGKGWIFSNTNGIKGMYDPGSLAVTKEPVGTQLIDPTRPNKYLAERGIYNNYYQWVDGYYKKVGRRNVWVDGYYELVGEAVTINGSQASKIKGYYLRQVKDEPMTWIDKTKPEDCLAPRTLTDASSLKSYEYGKLICNGQHVGYYHDFHNSNKSVPSYNGSGLELGSKAAERNITLTGADSAVSRYFFRSPRLPEGRYSIRVRRLGKRSTDTRKSEVVTFNEVNEIVYSDIDYNHSALLQLSIKATSNISSTPKVTLINTGRVIRVWDDTAKRFVPSYNSRMNRTGNRWDYVRTNYELTKYPFLTSAENSIFSGNSFGGDIVPNVLAFSRPAHMLLPSDPSRYNSAGYYGHSNPAWIVYDMMTDSRFGGCLHPSRLDFWAFKEWAEYCEAKGLHFNAVFDSQESLWDQIAKVFRVGRANPIRVGTKYSVSIEKPSVEVMRFGQDNIKEGTFSVNWLPVTDRANEVEVTYYDKAYDYKQRVIKVYDPTAFNAGEKPISSPMTLIGVTDYNQAVREANFAINTNKLVEVVSFTTGVSSLACTVGDVIRIQHNMMDWGEAGKILSVIPLSSNRYSIKLDHEIQFDSDTWSILVNHDFASVGTFTVKSKSDMYITLNGFRDINSMVSRAMVNGKDVKVLDIFKSSDGSGDCGICVENAGVFAVGSSVELFLVNTFETATISPATLSGKTDTVIATLNVAPSKYNSFMIGKTNFTSKLFTVRSITLASDSLERIVTALEYDSRVYDDTNTNFQITEESAYFALKQVQDVTVTETGRYDSNVGKIDLTIAWSHDDERYKDAAVTITVNEIKNVSLGRHIANVLYTARSGDKLKIIITPYSALNKPGTIKTLDYAVSDAATVIDSSKPTGGSIVKTSGGSKLTVNTPNSIGVKETEVWAIVEGSLIDGVKISSTIAETIPNDKILQAGKILGYTVADQFTHVAETAESLSKSHYYFARAMGYDGDYSDFAYIGVSKPVTSIHYNTVSVYCLSATTPETPAGGTYENPVPDGNLWSKTPPVRASDDTSNELWMSSRRFCNFIESQEPVWSEPSAISSPVPDVSDQIMKTWVAYADDPAGTNMSFTYDPSKHLYRGVAYNKKSSDTPTLNAGDYTWTLIVFLTDIVSSEQRNILSSLKAGKLIDQSDIVVSTSLQSAIDATIVKAASDATTISNAAANGAKAEAIATAASDATTKSLDAMKYADTQRSINWLKNAAFEMQLNAGAIPYWTISPGSLTGITAERRDGAVDTTYGLSGGVTGGLKQVGRVGNAAYYADIKQKVPVVAGMRYGFSAYTGAIRCKVELLISWYTTAGVLISSTSVVTNNIEKAGGATLADYKRLTSYGDAPANAGYAMCILRKYDTNSGSTDSYMMFTRCQFGEWGSAQLVPPTWCPGVEPLVADGQIVATNIADSAITAVKIADAAITASKTSIAAINSSTGVLNANTVSGAQMLDGAVSSLKLADAAVTAAKTSIASIDATTGNLKAGAVGSTQIMSNAVTAVKIAAGAVDASKTAIAAINSTTGGLNENTVSDVNIAAGAVKSSKLAIRKHLIF